MNKQDVLNLIEITKGQFFSLTYKRKDGETVTRCAKDKNLRILKGGKDTHAHANTVRYYDRNKGSYRSFIPENFISLTVSGVTYEKI